MTSGPDTTGGSEPRQAGCSCVNLVIVLSAVGIVAAFVKAGIDTGGGWGIVLGLVVGLPLAFVVAPVVVVGGLVILVMASGVLYNLLTASFEGDARGLAAEILGDDDPDAPRTVWRRWPSILILSTLAAVWAGSWLAVWLQRRPAPGSSGALALGFVVPGGFVLMWAIDRYERRQKRGGPRSGS
jgi:hypothetical protein